MDKKKKWIIVAAVLAFIVLSNVYINYRTQNLPEDQPPTQDEIDEMLSMIPVLPAPINSATLLSVTDQDNVNDLASLIDKQISGTYTSDYYLVYATDECITVYIYDFISQSAALLAMQEDATEDEIQLWDQVKDEVANMYDNINGVRQSVDCYRAVNIVYISNNETYGKDVPCFFITHNGEVLYDIANQFK